MGGTTVWQAGVVFALASQARMKKNPVGALVILESSTSLRIHPQPCGRCFSTKSLRASSQKKTRYR